MNEQATSAISNQALDFSRTVITAMIETIDEQISDVTAELATISSDDFVLGMATIDVNGDADAVTTPVLSPDAFVLTLLIRSLAQTRADYVEKLEIVDGISARKFREGMQSMFDDLFEEFSAAMDEADEKTNVDLDADEFEFCSTPGCLICRAVAKGRLAAEAKDAIDMAEVISRSGA